MFNNLFKEKHGEVVCCLIEGVGLIMGKVNAKSSTEYPVLNNPRAVQKKEVPGEQIQMRLGVLFGSPDEFPILHLPIFVYKVKDKKVREMYTQEVTGIVVTGTFPGVGGKK